MELLLIILIIIVAFLTYLLLKKERVLGINVEDKKEPEKKTETKPVKNKQSTNKIGPAAKKIIAEENIDSDDIKPSGKGNRITKADVINHLDTENQEENIFDKLSNDWWKIDGSFSALHAFNFVRIKFIKDVLGKKKSDNLKNLKILDIGCGGGILSEPLARLGAKVTGIDENGNAIKTAIDHARKKKLNIEYKKISFNQINFKKEYLEYLEIL